MLSDHLRHLSINGLNELSPTLHVYNDEIFHPFVMIGHFHFPYFPDGAFIERYAQNRVQAFLCAPV